MDDDMGLGGLRQMDEPPVRVAPLPPEPAPGVGARRAQGRSLLLTGAVLIVAGLGISALAPFGLRLVTTDVVVLNLIWGLLGVLALVGAILLALGGRHPLGRLPAVVLVVVFSAWLTLLYVATLLGYSVLEFFNIPWFPTP